MENPDLGSDNENGNQAAAQPPRDDNRLNIQRCIQDLIHACQCRNTACPLESCQRMKHVVRHTRVCQRKVIGGCPVCKRLLALCCYHGRHCQEDICPLPFCPNIKQQLRQHRVLQRLRQILGLRGKKSVNRG